MEFCHYILDDEHNPVVCDLMTWGMWKQSDEGWRVKQETLPNGRWVSTVFLGIDHGFGDGPPVLFETMVFPNEDDFSELDCERYCTWAEAEEGHKALVEKWLREA